MDRENVLYQMKFHFESVLSKYQQFKMQNDIFKGHEHEALKNAAQQAKLAQLDEYQKLLKIYEDQFRDSQLAESLNKVLISPIDRFNQ